MKKFHLGDVLTITTGRLVSPAGIKGVYDILNYMTGDNLFTHQLPRACDECKPFLLEQFPQLANVDASGVNTQNHEAWLAEQVAKFGEECDVKPIPKGSHEFKNPISEILEMTCADSTKVIPVVVG